MKARRSAPSLSTRERILEATLDLAGREGLATLTTRRVAEAAGVNLGLLHYHFSSKEDLVRETLGCFIGELQALFEQEARSEAPGDADAEEELFRLLAAALEHAAARPGLFFGLVARIIEELARLPPAARTGPESAGSLAGLPQAAPLQVLRAVMIGRIQPLLAARLGADQALLARRGLQLFASIFHPALLSPLPGLAFGLDLGRAAGRAAYVRGVVSDAFALPGGTCRAGREPA